MHMIQHGWSVLAIDSMTRLTAGERTQETAHEEVRLEVPLIRSSKSQHNSALAYNLTSTRHLIRNIQPSRPIEVTRSADWGAQVLCGYLEYGHSSILSLKKILSMP
jgi:hypothetical protein